MIMNKPELISAVAGKTCMSKKDVGEVISATLSTISDELRDGGKVQIVGFGAFETRMREARVGRNPQTNESVEIPARRVPVFKAGKGLKDAVAG